MTNNVETMLGVVPPETRNDAFKRVDLAWARMTPEERVAAVPEGYCPHPEIAIPTDSIRENILIQVFGSHFEPYKFRT